MEGMFLAVVLFTVLPTWVWHKCGIGSNCAVRVL